LRWLAFAPLLLLTNCAVTLPFNHRLAYDSVTQVKAIKAPVGPLSLVWIPGNFPERIDTQGASGFVGMASQTRIPTGVGLASRITEALDAAAGVSPAAERKLTIRILKADSRFEYSAGIFNVTEVIDEGRCTLEAEFTSGDITWTGKFEAKDREGRVGGRSATGVLESVWDDIAVQVAKDVVNHLSPKP